MSKSSNESRSSRVKRSGEVKEEKRGIFFVLLRKVVAPQVVPFPLRRELLPIQEMKTTIQPQLYRDPSQIRN